MGGGNGEFPDKKRLVFYKNKELHMGDSIRIQGFAVVCYSIYTTFQNDNEWISLPNNRLGISFTLHVQRQTTFSHYESYT